MTPKLSPIEQPLPTFYKDEGGKSNQLHFKFSLDDISPEDIAACGVDSSTLLPLTVVPVFENGELVDRPILEILGGSTKNGEHEELTSSPCLSLKTLSGGVRYRITVVGKRLGNRSVGLKVSLPHFPQLAPILSDTTMVFSKRKNKERRNSNAASSITTAKQYPAFEDESDSDGQTHEDAYMNNEKRPKIDKRSVEERIDDLDAEQKKLLQVILNLKRLNQEIQRG